MGAALDTETQLRRVTGSAAPLAPELTRLAALGMGGAQLAELLILVAAERRGGQAIGDRVELVWTGPELPGTTSRATATVVRELFRAARESVLLATYSLDSAKNIKKLLGPLRERMAEHPDLEVSIFVNVGRKWKDRRPESVILREFADRLRKVWPTEPRPPIFHDPRALAQTKGPKACLHAKCVVIDNTRAFVSSANFSEAAQERNIEAGVIVEDATFARALAGQFVTLAQAGALVRVPGV